MAPKGINEKNVHCLSLPIEIEMDFRYNSLVIVSELKE